MASPKTCERCGHVSFSRGHDVTRRGWTAITVGGQEIWTCERCQQQRHEQIHDKRVAQMGLK